jgi:LacI family transcriptional regulator
MAVRIEDVALRCGYSTATVSRVLSGKDNVSAKAAEKVYAAIKELKYTPNALARGLVRKKTNLIGIVISDISTFFSATILGVIEKNATQIGYSVMICNVLEDIEKEKRYIRNLMEMQVDGIILMHEKIDDGMLDLLHNISVPVVCASVRLPRIALPTVIVDDEKATYDAVQYLISLGHRNIAYFGYVSEKKNQKYSRFNGYVRALQENGIEIQASNIFSGGMGLRDGYEHFKNLMTIEVAPTAIFAGSDDLAIGAISCASDLGVEIPENISIIGFDNSRVTPFIRPALTTVGQSFEELGQRTMKLLMDYMDDPEKPVEEIIISHKIEIRASCRSI